jgi:hypothetical protein
VTTVSVMSASSLRGSITTASSTVNERTSSVAVRSEASCTGVCASSA